MRFHRAAWPRPRLTCVCFWPGVVVLVTSERLGVLALERRERPSSWADSPIPQGAKINRLADHKISRPADETQTTLSYRRSQSAIGKGRAHGLPRSDPRRNNAQSNGATGSGLRRPLLAEKGQACRSLRGARVAVRVHDRCKCGHSAAAVV